MLCLLIFDIDVYLLSFLAIIITYYSVLFYCSLHSRPRGLSHVAVIVQVVNFNSGGIVRKMSVLSLHDKPLLFICYSLCSLPFYEVLCFHPNNLQLFLYHQKDTTDCSFSLLDLSEDCHYRYKLRSMIFYCYGEYCVYLEAFHSLHPTRLCIHPCRHSLLYNHLVHTLHQPLLKESQDQSTQHLLVLIDNTSFLLMVALLLVCSHFFLMVLPLFLFYFDCSTCGNPKLQ